MEEQIKKQYSFLSDEISEARMYRQRNTTDKMTLQDTANFAFLNTLLLYILYNEYESSPAAVDYAARTMRYQNFNTYKDGGTDLYFAYYSLLGKEIKCFFYCIKVSVSILLHRNNIKVYGFNILIF